MDDNHGYKTVYQERIVRFINYPTYQKRKEKIECNGWTLLDTWTNDIGNIYAKFCIGILDEEKTYEATGFRYGRQYKCNNQVFFENLLNGKELSYFKQTFLYVSKRELVDYYLYLAQNLREYMSMDEWIEFCEYLKQHPIEVESRHHIES